MTEPTDVYAADPKPEPPREPDHWECCRSGCDPCVYDLYWRAVERYETAMKEWEERHGVTNVAPKA